MMRTVVAMDNAALADAVRSALERQGVVIRYVCRTGAEAIRAIKSMGGGVVICSFRLADMSANELSGYLLDTASALVVAKQHQLELLEGENVFKLALPVKAGELYGSTAMLMQMDNMRAAAKKPRRTAEEQADIDLAKSLLVDKKGYTEPAAHKYLQRKSMEDCVSMAATAKKLISSLQEQ